MEAKAFVFIMSLVFPSGALPSHSDPMPDLKSCLERVAKVHADFVEENETFRFVAGCHQVSYQGVAFASVAVTAGLGFNIWRA